MARTASVSAASVTAARWLVGVLASVVLCFVLATLIGDHLESAIAGRANDIISNAMPSVQLLSAARRDLRQLDVETDRFASAPPDQLPELRERIAAARRNLDGTLNTYVALPFFPKERDLYAHVTEGALRLDKDLADYMVRPDPTVLAQLRRDYVTVDDSIQRLVGFDATEGQELGLEIQRIRGSTRGIVMLLDAATILLAIGAAYLALRQLRRAAMAQKAEREARLQHEAELVAENEALGEFAGRVAHDVLSPLATAMLALEVVQHACEGDPAAHRATKRGVAAVERVQTLVDGLLAFSRAGGKPDPGVATAIAPVVSDVVDGLSGQAKEQRIALTVSPVPEGAIGCSAGVLTSLLSNLIRNSIKYMGDSTERRISLRVTDAGDRWRVEVEDTGPGIPPDQQERIFQPYVQLRHGGSGIGLGLATVDRLVRAHAGSLGVTSSPGKGCLFWFELPKRLAMQPEPARARAPLEPATLEA
jgi:signal transduction histidine kinase